MRHAIATRLVLLLLAVVCLPLGAQAEMQALVLPSALQEVAAEAFAGADSLERVVLPEGITSIGSRAFAESTLQEIVLPASLTSIAWNAFSGCTGLLAEVAQGSYAERYCNDRGIDTNWSIIPQTPYTPVVSASDSATALVSFVWPTDAQVLRLWRVDGASGAYTLCAALEVGEQGGYWGSCTDTGLAAGVTYAYLAEGVNQVHGREYIGPRSEAGWVTMPVPPRKTDYSDVIWDALTRQWGFTPAQAAGIMGNIYAECTYCPRNAQDDRYPGLDNGAGNAEGSPVYVYDINDGVGYGICQWTYPSRKQGLLNKAYAMGSTVEDIHVQLAFLKDELDLYMDIPFTYFIRQMTTLEQVCDFILQYYESPVGWETRVEQRRQFAREAYAMFAGK